MASHAPEADDEFFKLAPLSSWSFVILGMTSYEITVYQPNFLPCNYLGYFGECYCHMAKRYHSALKIGFWTSVFLHVVEGIYASRVCREMNLTKKAQLKWTLQTFALGYFSLNYLLKERRNRLKQK